MSDGSDLAVAEALEDCVASWRDRAPRDRAAHQLGIAIDDAAARALADWLDSANTRRRINTLSLAEVVGAIAEARDTGIAVRHGGTDARSRTTLALAVRVDGAVVVALGSCPAHSPAPDQIWKALAPWDECARDLGRVQAWVRSEPRRITLPLVDKLVPDGPRRPSRAALLAEVLARPHDDAPRLVYADALAEREDPRGEFIIVQCALAAGSTDGKLAWREQELRRRYESQWTQEARRFVMLCELRRGFVASVTMTPKQLAPSRPLFAQEPIEELRIFFDPDARLGAEHATLPHLAKLQRITFHNRYWLLTPHLLVRFRAYLQALVHARHLNLALGFAREVDHRPLFENLELPNVEALVIDGHDADGRPIPWEGLARAFRNAAITVTRDPNR